jgi:hypothetical protein
MAEDAHLTAAKDREGRFSGYYKCSLCGAEFRPNPENRGEMMIIFTRHIERSHPSQEKPIEE